VARPVRGGAAAATRRRAQPPQPAGAAVVVGAVVALDAAPMPICPTSIAPRRAAFRRHHMPLKKFVELGGTIVTIGSSTARPEPSALPVSNYLTEMGPDGKHGRCPREKFYIARIAAEDERR
jgi:hypothetical protein